MDDRDSGYRLLDREGAVDEPNAERFSRIHLALVDGIPSKIVAEVLGHSSTRVTDNLYQHVTPGMKADATARVAAMLRVR